MKTEQQTIAAARGAIGVERDTPESIAAATRALMTRLTEENRLQPQDIVSIIFTVTDDIRSANPATALRADPQYRRIPLLCAQEARFADTMPRLIRVLVHLRQAPTAPPPTPVYLNGAERLRRDLFPHESFGKEG